MYTKITESKYGTTHAYYVRTEVFSIGVVSWEDRMYIDKITLADYVVVNKSEVLKSKVDSLEEIFDKILLDHKEGVSS